ncbi:GGDEF domain-containing protein [Erythrobacter litoralis]|uniref:GGDEF domain-containing protein n=1 Tax=Erythrobacter litoralis TaxID=39960 RepID=UPI00243568E1|nr:GGDEF domain-containing protein [Erythrobacter litoralis]MDG6079228.1 GGDEF domain-containing protein [Erythrobacter litoralis]
MVPASPTLSPLRRMIATALAEPAMLHEWPPLLRSVWEEEKRDSVAGELGFLLKLGFALAVAASASDALIAPSVTLAALALRIAILLPLTLLGLRLVRQLRLGEAKALITVNMTIFGAIAMWVAAHGSADDMVRYSMSTVVTLLIGLLILPFTVAEKIRAALIFCLGTWAATLYPAAFPVIIVSQHIVACITAGIGGVLLARRTWRLESREFLYGLQQRFDREELEETNALLRELSESDPLTGLANRRNLERMFERQMAQAANDSLALLMIDIDHFKAFNDKHGHQAGDRCLMEVARLLERKLLACGGHVARFGGEEFVAFFRECDLRDGPSMAEDIRMALAALPIATGQKRPSTITASIGVARSRGKDDMGDLIARADEALYRAKNRGRNRVERAYEPVRQTTA